MKKTILAVLAVSGLLLAGCSTPESYGSIYSDKTRPVIATGEKIGSKEGKSKSINVMGIGAIGDAGTAAAAKNGGITKVSSGEVHGKGVVVFGKACTAVTGERFVPAENPGGSGAAFFLRPGGASCFPRVVLVARH